MKLIIEIPEREYKVICENNYIAVCACPNLLSNAIKNATPIPDNATNERMVGKWIKSRDCYGNNHFTCPFCEHDIATHNADKWDDNYCSNCGARMEGVEYEKGYIL